MKRSTGPNHGCDILIVGGGACGLAAALALEKTGFTVALADAAPAPRARRGSASAPTHKPVPYEGQSTALLPHSVDFLKKIGAWPDIAKRAAPIHRLDMVACDARGKNLSRMRFHASDNPPDQSRTDDTDVTLAHNIAHKDLVTALQKKVAKSNHINFFNQHILTDYGVEKNTVRAIFANGGIITARLIIAADGRRSTTRQNAGIDTRLQGAEKAAIVCMIDHTPSSGHGTCTEFHLEEGPLTLTALPPVRSAGTLKHRLALVWVHQPEKAHHFLEMDQEDFLAALQGIAQEKIGPKACIGPRRFCPVHPFLATRLTGPRLALIGESAHVLPPTGAQGFNLSLTDIRVLTTCLEQARDLGSKDAGASHALADYARQRKTDISARYWASRGLDRWASARNPGEIALRAGITRIIERTHLLKQAFIRLGHQ